MVFARFLFLLLVLLPLLEIYLLIRVGGIMGAIPTIALIVFTAVLGILLLQQQGFGAMQRAQRLMQEGKAPTGAMLEGLVILFSGILLLIPGLLTDALGLLGLVPPLRRLLVHWLLRRGIAHSGFRQGPPSSSSPPRRGPATLEGQYTREDE